MHPSPRSPRTVVATAAVALALLADPAAAQEAGAAPTSAPSLAARADALEAPAVGRPLAAGTPLAVGRGRFEGASGLRLLTAGGEPVGVLVAGGRFSYRVDDRFSVPVARRNVKRASSLAPAEADGALTVADAVRHAAVWDRALAARLAAAAPAPAESEAPPEALPQALREMLANRLFTGPAVELLAADGSGSGSGAAYALIDGAGEDLIAWTDPAQAMEGLAVVSKLSGRAGRFQGGRVVYQLADQPLGRPWWEPPSAALRAVHTAISLAQGDGRRVDVVTATTLRAERGGESLWRAELADSLFDGERLSAVEVSRVSVDGRPADHLHLDGALLVDLGRTLAAGETAVVEVAHRGDFALRPNNDSYWYLSTWSWYPQPAAPDGQLSTFEIEVRTPAPFVPYASGTTVERRDEKGAAGGKEETVHLLRTRLDEPMHLPVVAAGRYQVFPETRNGIACNVTSYVFGKEKPAEVLRGLFFSAAETFEQFFGVPYPFDEVDVVEINQWGFGQAPAGVIFITQEAYNPLSSEAARYFSQGVNGRFVHEVAHAWWGHVVKTGPPAEQWLAESFADYSAALAMRSMLGGKKGEREFESTLKQWKANASRVAGGSVYLANYLAGEDEQDAVDRYNLLYNKGPLVLHALRQELGRRTGSAEQGDRYFQALLRALLTNFQGRYGETRHLVGILDQMTGEGWQGWFERYVYGTEMPPLE